MSASEFETMKHYLGAEKICNLIFTLEMTLEFVQEYSLMPDEEIRKALNPKIDELKKWLQ